MSQIDTSELFSTYRFKVMGYIRSRVQNPDDAEDLCEEVFVKLFGMLDRYDKERSAIGTLIYSIAHNTVIDFYRKNRQTDELPEEIPTYVTPVDDVEREDELDRLASALETLPHELVDIIVLRYYDSKSLQEISQKLGMSYGVVKIKHQKALSFLREQLSM